LRLLLFGQINTGIFTLPRQDHAWFGVKPTLA
jgi:hypothetical protein